MFGGSSNKLVSAVKTSRGDMRSFKFVFGLVSIPFLFEYEVRFFKTCVKISIDLSFQRSFN